MWKATNEEYPVLSLFLKEKKENKDIENLFKSKNLNTETLNCTEIDVEALLTLAHNASLLEIDVPRLLDSALKAERIEPENDYNDLFHVIMFFLMDAIIRTIQLQFERDVLMENPYFFYNETVFGNSLDKFIWNKYPDKKTLVLEFERFSDRMPVWQVKKVSREIEDTTDWSDEIKNFVNSFLNKFRDKNREHTNEEIVNQLGFDKDYYVHWLDVRCDKVFKSPYSNSYLAIILNADCRCLKLKKFIEILCNAEGWKVFVRPWLGRHYIF